MKWPEDIKEAKEIQHTLKKRVKIVPLKKQPEFIAGVDAAFSADTVIGAVSVYKYPEMSALESSYAVTKTSFPYIPGYLSFREGPAIISAIKKLKIKPDLVLFDGQGVAHPKGMGIAAHIGVLINTPSAGCAKSRLVGDYKEPGIAKGQYSDLKYHGRIIGAVLRTRDNVRPVFVSPGHLIDLKGTINIVLKCTDRYRIPEPLRQADYLSKKIKKELE